MRLERRTVMSHPHWNAGCRALITGLLVLVVTATSSVSAFANVHYRVWFFDDMYEIYEEGDITQGTAPLLTPPWWACGLRLYDPQQYRWVDSYGGTIDVAVNATKNITVWVSKPGCPQGFTIVHGNQTLSYEPGPEDPGASYLEIAIPDFSKYGIRWVDENGEWPICGDCAVADAVTSLPRDSDSIGGNLSAFATVAGSLLNPRTQPGVLPAIAGLTAELERHQLAYASDVAARRRYPLGEYEGWIRALEDAALRGLADARRQLDSCIALAAQGRFGDAFIACTAGGESLEATKSLIQTAQFTFELP